MKSWIESFKFVSQKNILNEENCGYVFFFAKDSKVKFKQIIQKHALSWQQKSLLQSSKELIYFTGNFGPVWILSPHRKAKSINFQKPLQESDYAWSRDIVGSLVSHFKIHQLKCVYVEMMNTKDDQELGMLVGMGLGAYNYREVSENQTSILPQVFVSKQNGVIKKGILEDAVVRANAINLARHWVNLPPNELNCKTFPHILKNLKWPSTTKLEIWDSTRLKKENMNLLLSVGQGAEVPPCLVRIKYRPKKKSSQKPIAFVGKGITFDTGGLDIKPSSGMRLMKKDMGGSAAVAALAYWVSHAKYPRACDFYLALAENAVDGKSFRPSDVIRSRSGMKVEIDNTDAEGRLVLADALDVACQSGVDEPEYVIDVATLTGAIKVALGADVAGLFSNDDDLAAKILKGSQQAGDFCWRMPLVEKYFSSLSSVFADFKNSSEGFGGAITAALFLQRFTRGKKWAHLDIYAWNDKPSGALLMSGGSGQGVQALIQFLKDI